MSKNRKIYFKSFIHEHDVTSKLLNSNWKNVIRATDLADLIPEIWEEIRKKVEEIKVSLNQDILNVL